MKKLLIIILLSLSLPAFSEDAGKEKKDLADLRQFAESGNASAQFNIGEMYRDGEGVPKDFKEAAKWFLKSAEQNNPDAQSAIGWLYYVGRGVPKDFKECMKWYRKAAEQGDANAQHFVGLLYINGEGVPQDDKKALEWYLKAAEQGYASSQRRVGQFYAEGRGEVPKDVLQAYMWFNLAAGMAGHRDAEKMRDDLCGQMTPTQIEEGKRLTREWQEKHPSKKK